MTPDQIVSIKTCVNREAVFLTLLQPLLVQGAFSIGTVEFLSRLVQSFDCERASLGLKTGNRVKICAVSSHYQEMKEAILPEVIAAMEESLVQETTLAYPHPVSDFPYIVIAHGELARRNGLTSVLTIPLVQDKQLIGAITLESRQNTILEPNRLWLIERIASDTGPLLKLKWSLEQPFWRRILTGFRRKWTQEEDGRLSRSGRMAVTGLLGFVLLVLFALPLPNHVSGNARLEASVQRVISAPIDGYLKEIRVRPGDRVEANQLLAELNDETLLIQQRRLAAETLQQENAVAEAMVKADRTQFAVSRTKLDELLAQKELVDEQLARTRLVAPFDGIVIKGDLTQLLGTPIKRSDALLTLSKGAGFRVIVEVNEQDIADIQVEQSGTLVVTALPAEHFDLHVVRITPVANTTTEGQNVFEVEARLDTGMAKLAPGLKGVAKIVSDTRPVGWKWVTRVWHSLSYTLWSLMG
jgi:multidrug resistance efflux pump